MQKIDVIVTQHAPLVRYLIELGIATDRTPVIAHAAIHNIAGLHVAGVLPVSMAAHCASYTEVPMSLTPEDRAALRQGDLPYERMVEIAGKPVTYYIGTDRPWPVMRVFDRAVRAATAWSTFHVSAIGPGLLRLEAAEGTDWCELDLYKDRYRTQCIGSEWSPWLDENGERHECQDDPPGEYKLEKATTHRLEGCAPMLKNVKNVTENTKLRIINEAEIRMELTLSGVKVYDPDPHLDGKWSAVVNYQAGERSIPKKVHLVELGGVVKAYTERGTMSAGRQAWIEDGRLVLEGDED